MIRVIGWLLIFVGTGWLLLQSLRTGPVYRGIIHRHQEQLPSATSFSRNDVQEEIYSVGRELYRHQQRMAVPTGVLATIGGFVCVLSGQRKRKSQQVAPAHPPTSGSSA